MKTLGILIASACLSLLFACSKDDVTGIASGISSDLPLKSAGLVINLSPNGTNDTQALLDAFAQANASGKKAVIRLAEGTFKIGMIEVKEFNGTLLGSGMGKTIITNLASLPAPDVLINANKIPSLVKFIGGDVSISGLSVNLSEGITWLGEKEMNMLLFADFAADFTPALKRIRVDLNNVEVTGILQKNVLMYDGVTLIDYPYSYFTGVKFASDVLQKEGAGLIPRSNIDINVSNSKFSNFSRGIYAVGCKSGNFNFGVNGGNIFTANNQGLVVNENIGVRVRIMNNDFTIPDWYWDGVDLSTMESSTFEYIPTGNMVCDIWNNTFNLIYSEGIGIWDNWRYDHPENPAFLQVRCEGNTFNLLTGEPTVWMTFALKDAVFSKNRITGDGINGWLGNFGTYWIPPDDPNFLLSISENCKILDNRFLTNVFCYMEWDTQNYLVQGDLSNLIAIDNGTNNKFIGLSNKGHIGAAAENTFRERIEKVHARFAAQRNHTMP